MTKDMIDNWIELIKKARAEADWDSSDAARNYLKSKGILVKYKLDGSVEWQVDPKVPHLLHELWCTTVIDDSVKIDKYLDDIEAYIKEIPGVYNIRRKHSEVHFNVSCEDMEERNRMMDMIRHDMSLISKDVGKMSCGERTL